MDNSQILPAPDEQRKPAIPRQSREESIERAQKFAAANRELEKKRAEKREERKDVEAKQGENMLREQSVEIEQHKEQIDGFRSRRKEQEAEALKEKKRKAQEIEIDKQKQEARRKEAERQKEYLQELREVAALKTAMQYRKDMLRQAARKAKEVAEKEAVAGKDQVTSTHKQKNMEIEQVTRDKRSSADKAAQRKLYELEKWKRMREDQLSLEERAAKRQGVMETATYKQHRRLFEKELTERQDGIRASRLDLHRRIDDDMRTAKALLEHDLKNRAAAVDHTLFLKLQDIEHHPPDPFEDKKS